VDLVLHADGRRVWRASVEDAWADSVTPDSNVEAMLRRYRPMVERRSGQKIAVLRDSLLRQGQQFPLGNLIADAQRGAAPGIDFAITNNGGIRRDLYTGPLTYGDLFELQPFSNNVIRVWMTGAQLRDLLEHAVGSGAPAYHISGLVVRYDPAKAPGARVLSVRRSNDGSIDPRRTYVVAMSDFLQGGGEGLTMLGGLRTRPTGKTDLDALIAHLKRLPQPVAAPLGPRFIPVTP
jgi:5'-nucleotidase